MQNSQKIEQSQPQDNKFLGTIKVGKLLRMFSIPCVLSLIIQALYNIVDQIFIGNASYLPLGNTATGIVYPLTVIALALGLFLGDGTAATISINQGKNQTEDTHKSVGTGLTIGLIVSIVLVAVSYIFCEPILKFFGARGEASIFLADAKEYSTWIIAGFPIFLLACVMNSIVRADGSPKFAMLAMAIGAIVNIILDPIFIFVANMGMTGAALATFIGQLITFALNALYFIKSKNFKLKMKSFKPDFKLLGTSLKLGISSFLTQLAIVIISVVNNILLGAFFVATVQNAIGIFTVVFKVFGIVISVAIGVTSGGQPILGYNYGAKKYDRVKDTFKIILIVTIIIGVIATILFEFCQTALLAMFGYSTKRGYTLAEIQFGINAFRIYLGFILLTCVTKAVSIFFQAIGHPVKSSLVAMLRDVIFLIPLAVVLPFISTSAFLWSAPISDVLTTIVASVYLILFFKSISKQGKQLTKHKNFILLKSNPGLIVTISREHGAGGREIGKALAARLGVPFYDKEVAMLAAQETGLAEEFVNDVEDKTSMIYSLYLGLDANLIAINAQQKVFRQIADNGAFVIVGRAADFILKDYNPCKILVYAPVDYKVKRIMQNYGDNEKLAKENCEKSDKRRAKFYNSVTGATWGDKNNYNLAVDSSVGIDATVETICKYIEGLKNKK